MSVLNKIKSITSSKGFKKYFSNTFWLMGEKFFRLGIAMAVSIYVARFLEPVNFGLLNYAKGFVGLFTAFATLGLDKIAVRDLVRDPSKENEITGTAYWLKVMGFGAMVLAIMISVNFTSNDDFTNTLIFIIASAELFRSFRVIDFVYRSQVRAKVIARVQMVQIVVSSLLKLYLIYLQADLIWFAYIVVFDAIFTASGLILSYSLDKKSVLKWKFSRKMALELVYEAWPLTLYGLALFIQAKIDQVMIKEMMGDQGNYEVGQYSVALKLIELFGFVPTILVQSFAPAITKAKARDPELYHQRLLSFYRLVFLLFIVVSIPLFFTAEWIVVTLYGEPYRPAGILLSLFAIRLLFTNMGVAKSQFITNESLFKYSLMTAVVGAVVNILVNYFMIPLYGAKGAIIATIVSFTISVFILDIFFLRTRYNLKLMLKSMVSFWKIDRIK